MTELTALRLYCPLSAKASVTRLWHKFSAPNLAQHLLVFARRSNIKQALLYHVSAGYLPGEKLSHDLPEGSSMKHPQCLELIDTEEKIRQFLQEHKHELHKVRVVLFRCELPLLNP
jgi:PII-like signaling protein